MATQSTSNSMLRPCARFAVPGLVALFMICLCVAGSGGAAAAPRVIVATKDPTTLTEMQHEADRIEREIKRLDDRLEVAVEDYNLATARLAQLNADLSELRITLERQQSELARMQDEMGMRLELMYKTGDWGFIDALLSSNSIADVETQIDFFSRLSRQDSELEDDYSQLVEQMERSEALAADRREEALAVEQQVETEKRMIEDKLAERESILKGLDKDIRKILSQRARIDSATAARLARVAGLNLRSVSGSAAQIAVVSEALKYLGVPYVWGGASPSGFDCSGLVMYVYAKYGVHVPHLASYQANPQYGCWRVAYADLQPADLVFFGTPIHHVAIYAGNGMFIHAPHTGDVVKVTRFADYELPSVCVRYHLILH
jgi:peptidoglycan DL-endopeptidase CwlO